MENLDNIISVKKLSHEFGTLSVLKNLNLEVEEGEFITIFGPNGAGKTTLMKIMSTLLTPSYGTVRINGFDTKKEPADVRTQIGVISHDTYMYQELTAHENLEFYGKMYGLTGHNLQLRISDIIKQVGLKYRANDRVGTFSRGMKQRISIARSVIHDPKILFLDEPYTGLDTHAAMTFERVLHGLKSDTTKIMISHDIERGLKMADRVMILAKGKFLYSKHIDEIEDIEAFKQSYEELVGEL